MRDLSNLKKKQEQFNNVHLGLIYSSSLVTNSLSLSHDDSKENLNFCSFVATRVTKLSVILVCMPEN